jgi:NADPH2:quinone reductase
MKALIFNQIGHPLDVLQLEQKPLPEPGKGEVRIRMAAASINPGDFLFVQNLYPEPKRPVFPGQIAGNHGAGWVDKAGPGSTIPKDTLAFFSYYNTWAEYAVIPAEWLIPLPPGYELEKAGQLVNLITAYDLVREAAVESGSWLAITAGNAAVSLMAAQFAQAKGIKVLSLVRKIYTGIELTALGAAAVLETEKVTDIKTAVQEITGGQGISGIIDNVGGPITGELIRSLNFGSQVIINGGMSEERFALHNFDILLSGLLMRSYVYRYFFVPPPATDAAFLQELIELSGHATFKVPVGGWHRLDNFMEALQASAQIPQNGKHFFTFQ